MSNATPPNYPQGPGEYPYAQQSAHAGQPLLPQKRKRGSGLLIVGLVLGFLIGLVVGIAGGGDPSTVAAPGPTTTVTTTTTAAAPAPVEPAEETTATEAPAASFDGKPGDFDIAVKVRKKECFGSAGCNVTYQIDPKYTGSADLPDTGTIEVTYEVSGDEDGPQINTFSIDADGTAHFSSEEEMSTPKSSTKLKAKATDVSYSEG